MVPTFAMINRTCILTILGILATAACTILNAADQSVIPAAMPQDRYQPMITRSPFSLATAEAEPSAPSFAENLFVTGLAKLGEEDIVTISSRGNTDRPFTLVGPSDSFEGITLVSVDWSDEVGKSRVTLKKGADVGVIEFNEAVIKSPIAVTPPAPNGRANTPRPRTGTSRPRIPTPNVSTSGDQNNSAPNRRARRVIRRPGDR